jgi:hypothetical protein
MDWKLVLVTFAVFLLAIAGMAIGVVFGRKPLKGSCGGIQPGTGQPDPDASCDFCDTDPDDCPNKDLKKSRQLADQASQSHEAS